MSSSRSSKNELSSLQNRRRKLILQNQLIHHLLHLFVDHLNYVISTWSLDRLFVCFCFCYSLFSNFCFITSIKEFRLWIRDEIHSSWWNYVNELLYVFSWLRSWSKSLQFSRFDLVRSSTISHSVAIDIKLLNVIWTLNLVLTCHTTMHHDFEKSKTLWTFSEINSFRLSFLIVI